MDAGTRRRIIALAQTAPSVDNAQPFSFTWQDTSLLIHRDPGRDRKRGNAGGTITQVGLGCLLECISIAASGEPLTASFHTMEASQDQQGPVARVDFEAADFEADPLIDGLALRASDRRIYRKGALSDPVFQEVLADVNRETYVQLYFQDQPEEPLVDYILRCDEFNWQDGQIMPEMLSWVRWSRRQAEETRDGIPWQGMGVNFITSRLMMLVAKSPRFRAMAGRNGGPMNAQKESLRAQIESSAALGCITVREPGADALVRLGRSFLRVWVRLNMAGYGLQVMANPSLHVYQFEQGLIPGDYPEASRQVFAEGREKLTDGFGIHENEIPAWMFRTGRSPTLPDEMRTLRLRREDIVREG
ncbi:MAG: hypothetical protein R3335_03575 [Anaerolineales bacterium]|nr:hypothetical protein [Anaerolineales bacterium]